MKPLIGILGGMGPRATVRFEQLLIERFVGSDQAIPTIITINDGSIPDRSRFLLGDGEDPLPAIQHNLECLEDLGASVICLPCNTASTPAIFSRLATSSSKLIDLPFEVGKVLDSLQIRRACLLATNGTVRSGTYQGICQSLGIDCLVPSSRDQALVEQVIKLVKRGDLRPAKLLSLSIAEVIERLGCGALILGCTELPLVASGFSEACPVILDSLAILADACVGYTKELRKTRVVL